MNSESDDESKEGGVTLAELICETNAMETTITENNFEEHDEDAGNACMVRKLAVIDSKNAENY